MRLPLRHFSALAGLLLFVFLCVVLAGSKFSPSTYYYPVTTTADDGPGSLRSAIAQAGDGDVVYFDSALNGRAITLTSGELSVHSNITIQGPGPDFLSVQPSTGSVRTFHILPGHVVAIQGLTIRRGGGTNGGAILNDHSTLELKNCAVREGIVSPSRVPFGGGIYNDGSGGSATLKIIDCNIFNHDADTAGGGIYNSASSGGSAILSMWNSNVTYNRASFSQIPFGGGGAGGGIYNSGRMTLTNCVVSNNFAGEFGDTRNGEGGGIANYGTATIIGSTIASNSTYLVGGGISNGGTLTIINTTVSSNSATGHHDNDLLGRGGGIWSSRVITLTNSTLSSNSANNTGGGLYGYGTVTHCTFAGNQAHNIVAGGDLAIGHTILNGVSGNIVVSSGTVASLGYNLSNDDAGGFLTGPGDQINTDPEIGPLQFNGGPTLTHAPSSGSPAIDGGDPGFAPPPYEDQRGVSRVYNGRIDIGSLEVQPVSSPTPTPTPTPAPCVNLNENFDGVTAPALPPGWVSSVLSGPANCTPSGTCALGTDWVTDASVPYSSPNSVFHNAPGCVTDAVLDSPSFRAGWSNGAYLIYRQSYDLETGRDGAVLEVSVEGGPFVDITSMGGHLHPEYNGTIASDSLSPLAGRPAWTGNSGGYQQVFLNFPSGVAAYNVRLRFRLATDCAGAGGGWRIDSVRAADDLLCNDMTPTPTPFPSTPTPSPSPSPSVTVTPTPSTTPIPGPARALNISTRLRVETGDRVMIGGFIISGSGPKRVVVRGIGPSLANFGITDALADPVLELRDSSGALLVQNDDWQNNVTDQGAQLVSLGLAPSDPNESGIVAQLPSGAAYTAILSGKNGGTGVGLVEVYDTDQGADSQLANLSTRGFVQTGNNVMIGGFILEDRPGGTPVVVRGIGPSLSQSGLNNVLADPTLELRDSNGMLLIANDNWQNDPVSAAQLIAHGLAPQDPLESGIFASLPAGAFTAILAGKNGGTGLGLVEIYHVQ